MTQHELLQLLKKAKNDPSFGGGKKAYDFEKSWQRLAGKAGFQTDVPSRRYTFGDYAFFVRYQCLRQLQRLSPMVAGAFVLIFGGWVTTVNASFGSLPGDVLYPVKLATESVRVSFADPQQRARLHVEFAGRRLEEAAQLHESNQTKNGALVRVAVNGFKKEIKSAQNDLTKIQHKDFAQAADVAVALNRKAEEFHDILERTSEHSLNEEGVREAVDGAIDSVKEVNTQTINTLVVTHEQQPAEKTADQLQNEFQTQYKEIMRRASFGRARIETIRQVILGASLDDTYGASLDEATTHLGRHSATTSSAMNSMAAGGYRNAFDLLRTVQVDLDKAEAIMVKIEIDVSTAMTIKDELQKDEPVKEVVSETSEASVDVPGTSATF